MAPSPKFNLKKKAWISPMNHGKWRNWAMTNNFGKMTSKPKEWLDKLGKHIRKPPDVGGKIARAKPLVKLTPQTAFKDARTKVISWLATKTQKQGFEEFFKKILNLSENEPTYY